MYLDFLPAIEESPASSGFLKDRHSTPCQTKGAVRCNRDFFQGFSRRAVEGKRHWHWGPCCRIGLIAIRPGFLQSLQRRFCKERSAPNRKLGRNRPIEQGITPSASHLTQHSSRPTTSFSQFRAIVPSTGGGNFRQVCSKRVTLSGWPLAANGRTGMRPKKGRRMPAFRSCRRADEGAQTLHLLTSAPGLPWRPA